ncbi:HAD hydrolase-like protein [Criibacterium bergeronii]|uniref:HAD family hydrolase n=1 Tax=Criibacterium bergeronii TaxID=1871336 RepID=A0A371IP84_9FIRM|nr:HAD hydrolase-like protein [Criibacterium bergeronii]RDY22302.1 hypothetical protein BBG48_000895 [Criibacterium bergeronii]
MDIYAPEIDKETRHTISVMIEKSMNRQMEEGHARLYRGIKQVLETLSKEHTLLFLSNCPTSYKDMARKIFAFDKYFSVYYWAQKHPHTPKYQIFSDYILKEQGEHKYVMVGDRFHDIEVGVKNNIPIIACLYGFGKKGELDDATYFAKKPLDILDIIDKIKNN